MYLAICLYSDFDSSFFDGQVSPAGRRRWPTRPWRPQPEVEVAGGTRRCVRTVSNAMIQPRTSPVKLADCQDCERLLGRREKRGGRGVAGDVLRQCQALRRREAGRDGRAWRGAPRSASCRLSIVIQHSSGQLVGRSLNWKYVSKRSRRMSLPRI